MSNVFETQCYFCNNKIIITDGSNDCEDCEIEYYKSSSKNKIYLYSYYGWYKDYNLSIDFSILNDISSIAFMSNIYRVDVEKVIFDNYDLFVYWNTHGSKTKHYNVYCLDKLHPNYIKSMIQNYQVFK